MGRDINDLLKAPLRSGEGIQNRIRPLSGIVEEEVTKMLARLKVARQESDRRKHPDWSKLRYFFLTFSQTSR